MLLKSATSAPAAAHSTEEAPLTQGAEPSTTLNKERLPTCLNKLDIFTESSNAPGRETGFSKKLKRSPQHCLRIRISTEGHRRFCTNDRGQLQEVRR